MEVEFNEADIPNWNLVICCITDVLFFLLQVPWGLLKVPIQFCFFRVKGRNFNKHTACSNICSLLLRESSESLLGTCFSAQYWIFRIYFSVIALGGLYSIFLFTGIAGLLINLKGIQLVLAQLSDVCIWSYITNDILLCNLIAEPKFRIHFEGLAH